MKINRMNSLTKITAIILAAFIAAVFIPVTVSAQTVKGGMAADTVNNEYAAGTSSVMNIAKIDFENRGLFTASRMIEANEVPLEAVPSEKGINMTLWWILVSVSLITTVTVIYESRKISPFGSSTKSV